MSSPVIIVDASTQAGVCRAHATRFTDAAAGAAVAAAAAAVAVSPQLRSVCWPASLGQGMSTSIMTSSERKRDDFALVEHFQCRAA